MRRDLTQLARDEWDVVVVGGGITGACVAWDAALRGLTVALVEKGDFGEATSSASSKLIHGGIRYLQQGQIAKVRESIVERRAFLAIAPHHLRPVPFLIPTYGRGMRGKVVLTAGMSAYEIVGLDRNRGMPEALKVEGFRALGRDEVLEREPLLPAAGLTGGVVFPEWHMHNSERMTLAFVEAAADRGAVGANYAEVVGFLGDGARVAGVRLRDRLESDGTEIEVRGRIVVNAAGPWAFDVLGRRAGADPGVASRMAHSKGCHLVVDAVTRGHALALATHMDNESLVSRGGRHIFLIPWRERTLIGTTNVPHRGHPDEMQVTSRDIDDFLVEIRSAIPAAGISRDRVQYAFGGLYPLVDTEVRESVYQGSGKYRIIDHAQDDGVGGLVTALGAKYTTARKAAEKCVDLVVRKLGRSAPACATSTTPLDGGDRRETPDRETLVREARRRAPDLDEDVTRELVSAHGRRWRAPVDAAREAGGLLEKLTPERPTIGASVQWAVREEMALRLADVVFRRTGLGTVGHPGPECLRACARLMASDLGWSEARIEGEVSAVEAVFARVS